MTFVKSSTKAGWLSLKAVWKQGESRVTFVQSSTKTGWLSLQALRKQNECRWKPHCTKALQKQDQNEFHWKLYENRKTFVNSSPKAGSGWLWLKALRKPFKFKKAASVLSQLLTPFSILINGRWNRLLSSLACSCHNWNKRYNFDFILIG